MLGVHGGRQGGSGSLTCEAGSCGRIEAVAAVSAVTAGDLIIGVGNWWTHIHIIKLPLETRARECIHWFQRGFLGEPTTLAPKPLLTTSQPGALGFCPGEKRNQHSCPKTDPSQVYTQGSPTEESTQASTDVCSLETRSSLSSQHSPTFVSPQPSSLSHS